MATRSESRGVLLMGWTLMAVGLSFVIANHLERWEIFASDLGAEIGSFAVMGSGLVAIFTARSLKKLEEQLRASGRAHSGSQEK